MVTKLEHNVPFCPSSSSTVLAVDKRQRKETECRCPSHHRTPCHHSTYSQQQRLLTNLTCSSFRPTNQGFPTRMVYLYYISCLRYTILAGNPGNDSDSMNPQNKQQTDSQTVSVDFQWLALCLKTALENHVNHTT